MSRKHTPIVDRDVNSEERMLAAERRCNDYRQAFLLMLHEHFENLDSTLCRMLEVLATTLDVERVGFWAFDDGFEAIQCKHQFTRSSPAPATPAHLYCVQYPGYFNAITRQLVIAADDARHDERTADLTANYLQPLGVTSMLDVPVRAFGRYIGVLCHEHVGPPRHWTVEDQHFAAGVATQIALAYEREYAKQAQQELMQRSLRDEESHLPNQIHLDNTLDEHLKNGGVAALVVTSVDQYNYVTGALGVQRMQQLVRQFSARLVSTAPPNALIARIAPNEFALLLTDVARDELPRIVHDWTSALKTPLVNGEQRLFLTLSTGYSQCDPAQPTNAELLRTEARLAAQDARHEGGDRSKPFSGEMRERFVGRIRMEQDLRRALEAAEFALYFQPIIGLSRNRCTSVEALLRWNHPQRGIVMPDEFMPVAIDSGIMLELGRRVLHAACEGIVKLREQTGLHDLETTINMSAPEILLPGTADAIKSELTQARLPASALTIEITESALIMDLDRAGAALEEIRSCGVKISLDDFGTAYSSLSWLQRLPIDNVKIDRSFVAGIADNPRDVAIIRSIIGLAKAFGQTVVAEGIESAEQLRILRELGIEFAQGYLFSRPEPLERFSSHWLQRVSSEALYPVANLEFIAHERSVT